MEQHRSVFAVSFLPTEQYMFLPVGRIDVGTSLQLLRLQKHMLIGSCTVQEVTHTTLPNNFSVRHMEATVSSSIEFTAVAHKPEDSPKSVAVIRRICIQARNIETWCILDRHTFLMCQTLSRAFPVRLLHASLASPSVKRKTASNPTLPQLPSPLSTIR